MALVPAVIQQGPDARLECRVLLTAQTKISRR